MISSSPTVSTALVAAWTIDAEHLIESSRAMIADRRLDPVDQPIRFRSIGRAGTPTTVWPAATSRSCVTTALAPTTASSPILTGATRIAPAPIWLRSPIRVGLFRLAVEVGRDRRRADIDPLADLGVTQVSQMPHHRAAPQVRLFGLDESAHFDAVVEHCPVAQVRERPDAALASRS